MYLDIRLLLLLFGVAVRAQDGTSESPPSVSPVALVNQPTPSPTFLSTAGTTLSTPTPTAADLSSGISLRPPTAATAVPSSYYSQSDYPTAVWSWGNDDAPHCLFCGDDYYRNDDNNWNSNNGNQMTVSPVGVVITILIIMGCIAGCVACCYCCARAQAASISSGSAGAPVTAVATTSASAVATPATFGASIERSKKSVIDAGSLVAVSGTFKPSSIPEDGTYVVQCDGNAATTITHLTFTRSSYANCWDIGGRGGDAFGSFKIEQGLVTVGGKAYWVERDLESGRRILSGGTFVGDCLMDGQWMADSGIRGTYSQFQRQAGGNSGEEADIPMANADLPVVDAVSGSEAFADIPIADAIPVVFDEDLRASR